VTTSATPPLAIGPLAVLVPVKSFDEAKRRLAPALEPAERARLARAMASSVVASAAPLPTAVVCDDADVAAAEADRDTAIRRALATRESAVAKAQADQDRVLAETLSRRASIDWGRPGPGG